MSYHNNNSFGHNNRGGFRNNSGGGFHHHNNHFNNNNNNGFQNHPRINEMQVPQSKHTIFIRGLHGDTTTEDIQEYIGEKVGRVSFDFVKQAQDGSKLFVAVRFEKRDEAKEFMEMYADREFMGSRCELSWFRDIRRYCAYQRAKQMRSGSQRRRRRSDSEESRQSSTKRSVSPPIRRRARSGSKRSGSEASRSSTRSKSPEVKRSSRTRTRSESRQSNKSRSRSSTRSRSSRRSRSQSSNRSRSGSSGGRSNSGAESADESRRESRVSSRHESRDESKTRQRSRSDESRQKRRRESSVSSSKDGKEEKSKIPKKKSKEELPTQIPLPPKASPIQTKKSVSPVPKMPAAFIPPPSVDMELESPPQHVTNPYYEHQQQFQNYQKQQYMKTETYSVPMEGESPPKLVVRPPAPVTPVAPYYPQTQCTAFQPPPPPVAAAAQPAFVPRQIGKIEILMPASLPAPPAAPFVAAAAPVAPVTAPSAPPPASLSPIVNGFSAAICANKPNMSAADNIAQACPTTNKLFGHLKAFQSALLSTVKYEAAVKKDDDSDDFSTLRLSTMGSEEDSEELKALEREQKLARLTDEQMMRFHIKKKQFETAYRNDCETYAVVTRALLAKDETLQFGLKTSLMENMDDLYKKMMQRVDDQLDALLA